MTDKKSAIGRTLQGLGDKFSQRLPVRLEQIEKDFSLLLEAPWDREVALRTHMELHKLSGTGGSFGFRWLSNAAHQCEEYLVTPMKHDRALTAKQKKELYDCLAELRAASAQILNKRHGAPD